METDWTLDALCRGMPHELFFPDTGANTRIKEARAVCGVCKVKQECLAFAMANRDTTGIWAGTTDLERRRMRKHAG